MRARFVHTESFRLAAIFATLFFGSTLVLVALVYVITENALKAELLRAADDDIAAIQNGYLKDGAKEAAEIIGYRLRGPGNPDYFLLQGRGARKLAGNLPAMPPLIGTASLRLAPRGRAGGTPGRVEILGRGAYLAADVYVFVGRDLRATQAAENEILRACGWIAAAALALGAGGGALLSNGFLARMDNITRTCRAIIAGQLTERIPARGTRDELDRLASTINQMLDRISALMESLRQLSSDVAHDLRTPLTHLRHRLEAVRAEATSVDEYAAAVDHAIADSERVLSMFSGLLRIAQIESGARRAGFAELDLGSLLVEIAEIYRPVIEDGGHTVAEDFAVPVVIEGDRDLLWQMFANLIENAINHTPAGTQIAMSLRLVQDVPTVVIADGGPGIPELHRVEVFRRFYRLERSRQVRGDGLGLSLVAAVAELHGAKIELKDNMPGVRAIVSFPRADGAVSNRPPKSVESTLF